MWPRRRHFSLVGTMDFTGFYTVSSWRVPILQVSFSLRVDSSLPATTGDSQWHHHELPGGWRSVAHPRTPSPLRHMCKRRDRSAGSEKHFGL